MGVGGGIVIDNIQAPVGMDEPVDFANPQYRFEVGSNEFLVPADTALANHSHLLVYTRHVFGSESGWGSYGEGRRIPCGFPCPN